MTVTFTQPREAPAGLRTSDCIRSSEHGGTWVGRGGRRAGIVSLQTEFGGGFSIKIDGQVANRMFPACLVARLRLQREQCQE